MPGANRNAHALVFRADSKERVGRVGDARHVLTFYDVDFSAIWPRTGFA